MAETPLLVNEEISRAKFERELAEYRQLEEDHQKRGWWMLKAEYPEVFIVFASSRLKPPAVIFGALIDFKNYDFWAPSVTLVNPFTRIPYKAKELPTLMKRLKPINPQTLPPGAENLPPEVIGQYFEQTQLLMAHSPDDVPFLCLPGVREYHQHPAHSGDSWLLHRTGGEGSLYFILDVLYRYGVQPIKSYNIQMIPAISFGQEMPQE